MKECFHLGHCFLDAGWCTSPTWLLNNQFNKICCGHRGIFSHAKGWPQRLMARTHLKISPVFQQTAVSVWCSTMFLRQSNLFLLGRCLAQVVEHPTCPMCWGYSPLCTRPRFESRVQRAYPSCHPSPLCLPFPVSLSTILSIKGEKAPKNILKYN